MRSQIPPVSGERIRKVTFMTKLLMAFSIIVSMYSQVSAAQNTILPKPQMKGVVYNSVSVGLENFVYVKWVKTQDPAQLRAEAFYWNSAFGFFTLGQLATLGLGALQVINKDPIVLSLNDGYIYIKGQKVGRSHRLRNETINEGFTFDSLKIDERHNTIEIFPSVQ